MTDTSKEELLEDIVALADSFGMTGYALLHMIQSRNNKTWTVKEELIIVMGCGTLLKGKPYSFSTVDDRVSELLELVTDNLDNDLYNE